MRSNATLKKSNAKGRKINKGGVRLNRNDPSSRVFNSLGVLLLLFVEFYYFYPPLFLTNYSSSPLQAYNYGMLVKEALSATGSLVSDTAICTGMKLQKAEIRLWGMRRWRPFQLCLVVCSPSSFIKRVQNTISSISYINYDIGNSWDS